MWESYKFVCIIYELSILVIEEEKKIYKSQAEEVCFVKITEHSK